MRYLYTLLFASLVWLPQGHACSCAYVPTFCESISYNGAPVDSHYVIVHARVESRNSQEMKIDILNLLFGTPNGSTLTIPQGYGADCRASIDQFEKGSEYIFALYDGGTYGYILSICGINWLEVSGNKARGAIAPGVTSLKISDFKTLANCGGIGSALAYIDVTPTLTSTDFEVSTSEDVEDLSVRVYDMAGRLTYATISQTLFADQPLVIPAWQFTQGCYAVVTETRGLRRVFRVAIVL